MDAQPQNPPATIPRRAQTPAPNYPEIPDRAQAIIESLARYELLQKALDSALPETMVRIEGKSFRTKAYWQAVALALGIVVELESETRSEVNGKVCVEVVYRASLGDRFAQGDGACDFGEPKILQTYHNVRSRAHTRAKNRAISALIAFGEVTAEESHQF